MHNSRKVFLLDQEPRCILADYENGPNPKTCEFKTNDMSIKVDDYIVVPTNTRHGMTVCKVVKVDVEPNLDCESEMYWVVSRIDTTNFDNVTQQEQSFLTAAASAEKRRKKEQLKKDFLADIDSDIKVIEYNSTPKS